MEYSINVFFRELWIYKNELLMYFRSLISYLILSMNLQFLQKCFLFTLILFTLLIASNCGLNTSQNVVSEKWEPETSDSIAVKENIVGLKNAINKHYSSNPDSAIFYYKKIIELYHQQNMYYNEFEAYTNLSELFIIRKSDGENAVYYYSEALKIMIQHNGKEEDKPYFYIDMGNVFFLNKLYPHAKKSIQKAIQLAIVQKDSFALSVAQNNMGILFRSLAEYDSSSYYFHASLEIRKKTVPLLEAYNYMYLAKLFSMQHNTDSMFYYNKRMFEALERQKIIPPNDKIITKTAAIALTKDILIDYDNIMALYHVDKGNYVEAITYYKNAKVQSDSIQDFISANDFLYKIATLYHALNDNKIALEYCLNAYQTAVKLSNFEDVVDAAKLLSELYSQSHDYINSNNYLLKAINYSDSLKIIENSEKKQASKILLITNQSEVALSNYIFKEEKAQSIIKIQKASIAILSALLLILCYLLYYIYIKRKLLKSEHLRQMSAILKSIEKSDMEKENEKEKLKKVKHHTEHYNEFGENLKKLFDTEKIYVQKNLALTDLASLLNTNTTYLSQFLNNELATTFNDYVNLYRIKEACRIFKNNTEFKYSIDQVADMVGFSSRTTFYTAFNKFTGITPAFFQKNISNPEILKKDIRFFDI